MARLTIEDKWWTDPRRSKLIKLLGGEDEADLAAVRLWKLAQLFWGNGKKLIPLELFEVLEASPKLLEAKLAFIEADGVYAKGSGEYLSWLHEKRQSASEGGKKSAEARRKKTGSAQPQKPKAPKQTRSTPEANSNTLEPSGSGSISGSSSDSISDSGEDCAGLKEPQAPAAEALSPDPASPSPTDHPPEPVSPLSAIGPKPEHNPTADFEARFKFDLPGLFALYPRPQKKSQAMHILSKAVRSREDYAAWERAIRNYAEHCRRERAEMKFILTFPNFAEEWTDWRDYSHKNAAPLNAPGSVRYEAAADVLARQETEREHVSENRAEAAKRVRELLAKAGKFGVARGSA